MTPDSRSRSLTGRSPPPRNDAQKPARQRRLLGDSLPWRTRTQLEAELLVSAGGRDDPRAHPSAPAASGEVALLAAWDVAGLVVALSITSAFGGGVRGWIAQAITALLALVMISAVGAYRRTSWLREHPLEMIRQLVIASTFVAWSGVIAAQALGIRGELLPLITTWLLAPVLWYAGRRAASLVRRKARPERILIVGRGEVARRVTEASRRPGSASVVVGCVDDDDDAETPDDPPLLGGIDQLPRVLAQGGIERVIVAFTSRRDNDTLDVLRNCTTYRGAVDIVPRFFDFVAPKATMYSADGLALLSIPGRDVTRGKAVLKRAIDIAASSLLLVALSPVLLLIAATILLDSGRPVLFRQRRIGMHGTTFSILKFRTLSPPSEAAREMDALELTPRSIGLHVEQAKQEAAKRATRAGAFLRKTSLDELPQLFNVLVGQMSLVGPRPLSPLEDAVLDGWELLRRDMRPGITGLWQVSGRSEISWEHRVNLDYRQVRHWSLTSDLHVLADTVRAVVRRRGAE
jgi:exopolysaccharide biosynthesis polyprenyl glycosylphosphotransferase